jgi:hypothetical protein
MMKSTLEVSFLNSQTDQRVESTSSKELSGEEMRYTEASVDNGYLPRKGKTPFSVGHFSMPYFFNA